MSMKKTILASSCVCVIASCYPELASSQGSCNWGRMAELQQLSAAYFNNYVNDFDNFEKCADLQSSIEVMRNQLSLLENCNPPMAVQLNGMIRRQVAEAARVCRSDDPPQ
jgi:hypothetical protein